jgi:hypothetical protein
VDQQALLNSGLEAKESRSIDLYDGDNIEESALKQLVRAAVAYNNRKR